MSASVALISSELVRVDAPVLALRLPLPVDETDTLADLGTAAIDGA